MTAIGNEFRRSAQHRSAAARRIAAGLAILLVAGGGLIWQQRARRVVMGRHWPGSARVDCDHVDHDSWDALLQRYVDESGSVDYAAWKESAADVATLDDYLASLSRADLRRECARPARLAFWINAYNALTVRGILREYPTSSIQNHVSWLAGYNIWRDLALYAGDSNYSLGQIEHDMLRPLHEPRVHFAIVCASRGCPRLLNRAYTAAKLERQLVENTRCFFADPAKLQYDAGSDQLRLSPILKWYADDFGRTQAAILKSIGPYLPQDVASCIVAGDRLHVGYLDYDWSLNDQGAGPAEPPVPPADNPSLENKTLPARE